MRIGGPTTSRPAHFRCWGKTAEDGTFHPALFHMLDAGHVAQVLLRDGSPRMCSALTRATACDVKTLCHWVPFIVSIHDLGKISAAFAGLSVEQKSRLVAEGFDFGGWRPALNLHHTLLGQAAIDEALADNSIVLPRVWGRVVKEMIGGHHGNFAGAGAARDAQRTLAAYEASTWRVMRGEGLGWLHEQLVGDQRPLEHCRDRSAAVAALTGFTILCDWLASDSASFGAEPEMSPESYVGMSLQRAEQAVARAGFLARVRSTRTTSVSALFPGLHPLRPLQSAIDAIPDACLARPCLAIIEAPTGEGKTEAALALAHRIAQVTGSDELYCALPSMATSNQMYRRLTAYLRDNLELPSTVQLVHGQAFLLRDELTIRPLRNGDEVEEQPAVEWFSSKKRALLAPFGVGTVDQAELAVLNTRHNMLRLFGLAGKVLILDEVHAYDTYMTTIIERLLGWLASMGTSVILLSATLPKEQRARLVGAYGADVAGIDAEAYPSLIVAAQAQPAYQSVPRAWQPNRQLELRNIHIDDAHPMAKANLLLEAVEQGGCACWITNTVARAQQLYAAVAEASQSKLDSVELSLLHARFPLHQRQAIEEHLNELYTRTGVRPARGIVIGTQVLEQSLDLDFDFMVSDLAPIDLLLQRAGRLHRHTRERPATHMTPVLAINTVLHDNTDAQLGVDAFVYDEYLLRQTWRTLTGRQSIMLPEEYRPLVEAVYGMVPEHGDSLIGAWQALQKKEDHAIGEAAIRLIPEPDAEESFVSRLSDVKFEESETSGAWIVAQTRLGEESLNVVPLEVVDERHVRAFAAVNGNSDLVEVSALAPREAQIQMLRGNLRITSKDVVNAVRAHNAAHPLPLFEKPSLLKGYVPILLFEGKAQFGTASREFEVELHPELGLVVHKIVKQEGSAT